MATNFVSDVSEGEIVGDLSEISSEDDYFKSLERKLANRKIELELENCFAGSLADYGKENHYSHRSKRPSKKKKRLKSNSRYDSSRDITRNRSYRASSVFASYPIHKRRRVRSNRKEKRTKHQQVHKATLRDDENESEMVIAGTDDEDDESSDEELLKLRLNALKSKQEVKELIDLSDDEEIVSARPVALVPTEEDNLRILALKSAVLKKKEFFKERKKLRMMENERPYSPSDDLTPMVIEDDAMSMVLSPLGSPFNNDVNEMEQQNVVDMDICFSPVNEEKETSDMDTAPSPNNESNGLENESAEVEDVNEEIALRSLLLTSIHKKKEVEKARTPSPESITIENLKLAVQRIKQKNKMPPPAVKSGTKTIAMILAEKKKNQEVKATPCAIVSDNLESSEQPIEVPAREDPAPPPVDNFLFRTVMNDVMKPPEPLKVVQPKIQLEQSKVVPLVDADINISTITDTKNIPLLPAGDAVKRSRLVTSFESVTRPVSRLVISVNADSESDDDSARRRKTPTKRIVRAPSGAKPKPKAPLVQPGFEKNLENFLKGIRDQTGSEAKVEPPKAPPAVTAKSSSPSSVKHLPLSSQVEYEQLLKKMKQLEAEKQKRIKGRQLKRTKSNLGALEPPAVLPTLPPKKVEVTAEPKAVASKKSSTEKITDSLSKIGQLDEAAQQRLIEKTEINYRNHSNNLMNATQQSIKLLDENEADMKKQEKIVAQIADLERLLKKYKTSWSIVNQRVKVNVHKIVQSQREMIKLRTHQKNFGKICNQVGTMVRGEGYSLPEHQTADIEDNFKRIVIKTEDIMKTSNDANVKSSMKLIAERVKTFVSVAAKEPEIKNVTVEQSSAKDSSPSVEIQKTQIVDEEESEVTRMINETSEISAPEEPPMEMEFPEIQKSRTGILDEAKQGQSRNVEKKLKYESPLDFLRLPKNKAPSVNKIVCPFQLEGMCNDENCKMMHI